MAALQLRTLFRPLLSRHRRASFAVLVILASIPALVAWGSINKPSQTRGIYGPASRPTPQSLASTDHAAGGHSSSRWGRLGMTHGHTLMAIRKTGRLDLPPSEWDYDLVGASVYVVAAAIDLILKSRAIAQLGDQASESNLLPALVCAERVVSLGTGSFIFTLAMARRHGAHWRTVLVAAIPLLFTLIASGFCFRAHQVISRTAPVICKSPFPAAADFPFAVVAELYSRLPILAIVATAKIVWPWYAAGICILLIVRYVNGGCDYVFSMYVLGAGLWLFIFFLPPIIFSIVCLCYLALIWAVSWVLLWCLVFILAFFPQTQFFPPTNISFLEMDQLVAPLAIAAVAVIRTSRAIYRSLFSPAAHADTDESSSVVEESNAPPPFLGCVAV
ncbi:hypothetical protein R3P38DRAFT_3237030 [Favolaschia claudopus]|uniref:Uncharacterized protein n=1 Tax=Favolaschia claudopus TaxID=2862362 RepID=A0AAV9ZC79_9AGAR